MAPTFQGPSKVAVCKHCGQEFLVFQESIGSGWPIRCWSCGGVAALNGQAVEGDRCEVIPLDGPLRRFMVIAFEKSGQRMIKRIWGLPGELIELRGGEVFIDGRPLQKSLTQFRHVAVHLSTWEHPQSLKNPTAKPELRAASIGRWTQEDSTLRWQFLRPAPIHPQDRPVEDWMECVRTTDESPCLSTPSQIAQTDDLLVELQFANSRINEPRSLAIQVPYGERQLQFEITNDNTLRNGKRGTKGETRIIRTKMQRSLTIALCDGRVLISGDQATEQRFAIGDFETSQAEPIDGLYLHAEGIEVTQASVYRDLAVHPPRAIEAQASWKIPGDAYFVLGDCQAISKDSRNGLGTVRSDAVLGTVLARPDKDIGSGK
ncbi:MAG TPA: hypothetical protein DDW52_00835 [Planctomycetaceae bacterium]|nr:hypothetical protein [Planctomycetaceae bacterium]